MKQCVMIEVAGKPCHLFYNNQAMFDLREMFPGEGGFLEMMEGDSRESYEAMLKVFETLAEQGELARRHYGYDPALVPDIGELEKLLDMGDWVNIKNGIYAAVTLGINHSVESLEDVDITLLEFQRQQEKNA